MNYFIVWRLGGYRLLLATADGRWRLLGWNKGNSEVLRISRKSGGWGEYRWKLATPGGCWDGVKLIFRAYCADDSRHVDLQCVTSSM